MEKMRAANIQYEKLLHRESFFRSWAGCGVSGSFISHQSLKQTNLLLNQITLYQTQQSQILIYYIQLYHQMRNDT